MSNHRSKVFRDAVHGLIALAEDDGALLLDLINTPEFQRLRRIRQLGVSSFTYPNAEHTRFVHGFGLDFKLALYGAYSSALQSQLEDFVNFHYIEEIPEETGVAKFPTSKFVVSSNGGTILESLGQEKEPSWKRLAIELNGNSTRVLEATSTILYLRRDGTRNEDLKGKFTALKPHLTDIFDKGIQLADRLPIAPK